MKAGVKIDRQQRRQNIKGKKQQEIAQHRLTIIGIPQTRSILTKFHIHLKNYALQT
jgi:hypothetical protein